MELSLRDPNDNDYTPSSFKCGFDFISDNNHTATMFSTTVDTILYLTGPKCCTLLLANICICFI